MGFEDLRKKHPEFIYHGFETKFEGEKLKVYFDFEISPNIKFKPEIIFPSAVRGLDESVLNNLIFNLGIVELLSYWKATCSPKIVIKAGYLDQEQIKFWKKLLIKGMGEFFYNNKIDFTKPDLVQFVILNEVKDLKIKSRDSSLIARNDGKELEERDLILVGGGKDSAVTLESIANSKKEFNCLLLNPTKAAIKIAEAGGCKTPIIIKRTIDPKLLELNRMGYLNGHTPFSAYLAFLATLAGVIYDYKNIVVSNESSSNEGNIIWKGAEINHQYSKSEEFEKDFRDYSKKYLCKETYYYSFLRSFNELEIARQFSRIEKYHNIFISCNKGSKQGIWCGQCSKCLFTYLILYPFLGNKLREIFGKDLLDDENLFSVMEELLQLPGKFKPFECVGTKAEIQYALVLSILKLEGKNLPKLLEKFKTKLSILILGMGREGQAVARFLEKNKIKFVNTETSKKDYLKNFAVIIKSPGIPYLEEIKKAKEKGKIITSATSIFFDLCKAKIIGITGTKGKSTTASLIYEVLKLGKLGAYLVGNIGVTALDLLDKLSEDSIVVYELSSFQLADLTKSPEIAVITNIYVDHLDWHGSVENYKKAKENIKKFQTKKDIFISDKSATEVAQIIGRLFKIPDEKINKAISNFKPLPHRLEFVGEKKGIKFYNDSLATNPHATIFGLNKLGDDVETLIAGGLDRGVDYSILGPAIAKSKIKNLILFPDTGEKIWKSLASHLRGGNVDIKKFDAKNMKEAVKLAFEKTSPGKICLMSPASASFNMFKDYEDRGNQFKKNVELFSN